MEDIFKNNRGIFEKIFWLYENDGIWIECLSNKHIDGFTFRIVNVGVNGKSVTGYWREYPTFKKYSVIRRFSSPEKAYKAAIEFVFNNILKDLKTNK